MGPDAIIAATMGHEIDAFEVDPPTSELPKRKVETNHIGSVMPHFIANLDTSGMVDFVRVKGNMF